jgi:hypothetical protein
MRFGFWFTAVVCLGALAAGCSSSPGAAPPGTFEYIYGTGIGPLITRPGWEYGYLFGDADNTSRATLTVKSVSLSGPGVGSVIALADVKLAPVGPAGISQGNYLEDPPVTSLSPSGCHKQLLLPVRGYRLRPGQAFRLWVVVRALKPGKWRIPRQTVTFSEDGTTYHQGFPIYYWGTVKTHAPVHPVIGPGDYQASCVKPEGSHYLDYYHGGS